MVTVGKTETGRPICKLLKPESYFRTYNEAYEALVEYGKHRSDSVAPKKPEITLDSLFKEWYSEISSEGHSESYIKFVRSCWNHVEKIYSMPISSVKAKELREFIVNLDTSSGLKSRIKGILSAMFDYAMTLEYIDHNPVKIFKLPKAIAAESRMTKQSHIAFTADEMENLWEASKTNEFAKIVLIQCYSGWRPGELLEIKLKDVDLEKWTFVGGNKTASGKNRIVPIHSKVQSFVKFFFDKALRLQSKYLFTTEDWGVHMGYENYSRMFREDLIDTGISKEHRPHDPRKFFITEAKRKLVDEYAIKRLVGHQISDITENVYTERDVEWLRSELEKM